MAIGFQLSDTDRKRLVGVHDDLVRVIERAATFAPFRFRITEGVRTAERQKKLYAMRATKTLNSRHLTGHAVDLVPFFDGDKDGDIDADDMFAWPLYHQLAPSIKAAAKDLGVRIEWGGDWRSFPDGPHWQLPWKAYPA